MPRYTSIAQFRSEATPTEAEEKLIAACQAGDKCVLGDGNLPETQSDARTVRADLLRLLTIGGSVDCGLGDEGVSLKGAWISGELHLRYAKARGQTRLDACHFSDIPKLTYARLSTLSLEGSHVPGIFAERLIVRGSVFFRRLKSTGTIDLAGAQIGGQLNFIGAALNGDGGKAINAKWLKVQNNLNLRRVCTFGALDFDGAFVGGQVSFVHAMLDGNGKRAFYAQNLHVSDGLFWREVSVIQGNIVLIAAHVGALVDDKESWPVGPDQLFLDGFTYDRISGNAPTDFASRLSWLKKGAQTKDNFYPQPYTQLAKVLSRMGHDRDARKLMERRELHLAIKARLSRYRKPDAVFLFPFENPKEDIVHIWSWVIDGLSRAVVGYGYAPMRSLGWLITLFLLATILAHFTWTEGSFAPNSDVVITSQNWINVSSIDCIGDLPEDYAEPCKANAADQWSAKNAPGMDWDSFNAIAYGADLVIPILDLGQTDAWAPSKDRGEMGWLLWWARWPLAGLGWLVTALGVAAITGIMQRNQPGA